MGAASLVTSACTFGSGSGSTSPELPAQSVQRISSGGKIKHIVIVIQENRSFNNLFYGFRGAKTAKYGYDTNGHKIKLQPVGLETKWDIRHSSTDYFAACNGSGSIPGTNCRMNGFDHEKWWCSMSGSPRCPNPNPPYSYVPHVETKPYFDMAKQYVLADEMYASNFDASSFISHQYIISGQAESAVNYPRSAWGCPGGPSDTVATVGPQRQIPSGYEVACWNPTTLADELDKTGISWAYYALTYSGSNPGIWSAYQAIDHIYNGADWNKDVISPPSTFLNDVANGTLRTVSWVTPTWTNSDHAGSGSNTGPSWVTSIVNAIGESKYWKNTAIFIFWDDYGGWFDSEPPAYVDAEGFGMRLPLLIISPYAKKGLISHVHYEHGSVLKFVEDAFGLGRLSASDTRANSPAQDCFDFSKPPRSFRPFQSTYDRRYFMGQPIDNRIPDAQ